MKKAERKTGAGAAGRSADADSADRAAGVLIGLAAGDRNGGPVRMALRLAESLLARGGFDAADVGARYLTWWRDGAFDSGPTAAEVLSLVDAGSTFDAAATQVDSQARGLTAGCNPAHRAAPLAACMGLDDEAAARAALDEARLTHRHPLAGDVAAAVVRLARALVRGAAWGEALATASAGRLPETRRSLALASRAEISSSGFAPDALGAAVYFLNTSTTFASALQRSIEFAGSANYCPVIVGSVGGARWGRNAVDAASLAHHGPLVAAIRSIAEQAAVGWRSRGGRSSDRP